MTANPQQGIWNTYTQAWNEANPSKRMQLFEQTLTPEWVYADPLIQTTVYEQLSGYMEALHNNVPVVCFVTTDFKSHHDRSLAHWNILDGNGMCLFQGTSYGLYGPDGRLTQMSGFFEPPPS